MSGNVWYDDKVREKKIMKKNEKGWKRMFGWIKAGVEGGMVKCLASYSGQKSLLRTTMKTQKNSKIQTNRKQS